MLFIIIAFALGEMIGYILGSGMALISDQHEIYRSGYENGFKDAECKLKGGENDNIV